MNRFGANRGLLREARGVCGRIRSACRRDCDTAMSLQSPQPPQLRTRPKKHFSNPRNASHISAGSCVYAGMSPPPADRDSLDPPPDEPLLLTRPVAELFE